MPSDYDRVVVNAGYIGTVLVLGLGLFFAHRTGEGLVLGFFGLVAVFTFLVTADYRRKYVAE